MQLAVRSTQSALRIHDFLQLKPSLAKRVDLEQAEKLFREPILAASKNSESNMVIIMIDAVDELADRKEISIVLFAVISRLPDNVKVIISCRPEDDIIVKVAVSVQLETKDSIVDMSSYVLCRMKDIRDIITHDPEWVNWPDRKQMAMLYERTDGHNSDQIR
jgi:predicted nucleic acid-binding protein